MFHKYHVDENKNTVLFIILSPLSFFLEIMIILKIESHPWDFVGDFDTNEAKKKNFFEKKKIKMANSNFFIFCLF